MGGVPAVLRGKVWYACTEAAKKRVSADKNYQELVESQSQLEGTNAIRVIDVDAPRSGITGDKLTSLKNILCAFVTRNPDISYCQSMNFIAASLLRCCPEEATFWVFCSIIEDILPADYYTSTTFGLRVDLKVMEHLIQRHLPVLWNHLMVQGIDLSPVLMGWFLCLFINTLPSQHSHRVMDCFVHEGSAALFRVALSLLCMCELKLLGVLNIADAHSFLRAPLELEDTRLVTGDALISVMYAPWMDNLSSEINNLRKECYVTVCEEDKAHAVLHGNEDPMKPSQQASNGLMRLISFFLSNKPPDLVFAVPACKVPVSRPRWGSWRFASRV